LEPSARLAASLTTLFLLLGAATHAETLTYQSANKWVAQADNAPLRALLAQAKQGHTRFTARLPDDNRDLAADRLMVLRDLLEKAAGTGVTITETQSGPAPAPNTLAVTAE
jgi:hypothetical protein